MHGFFVNSAFEAGAEIELERGERDHLFKTLRAREGDRIALYDGKGLRGTAVVGPDRQIRVEDVEFVSPEELRLILCCAAPRRAKLDVLLKQAVEIGVAEIRLIHCERSVAQPEGSDRWQTLLQEGCKQSRNPHLPAIYPARPLGEVLAILKNEGASLYYGAVSGADSQPAIPPRGPVAWLVGPEGGFSESEEELIRSAGGRGLSLGPWILRLETAALCGICALRLLAKDE
ncbi:MAG: 16S rRNA (uracil(1498)-N(3))-methyltransferase [Victivallaceae bacterium]